MIPEHLFIVNRIRRFFDKISGRRLRGKLTISGLWSSFSPLAGLIGAISLVVIVLLAEIPGLRVVFQADLGQVSKSQSI